MSRWFMRMTASYKPSSPEMMLRVAAAWTGQPSTA